MAKRPPVKPAQVPAAPPAARRNRRVLIGAATVVAFAALSFSGWWYLRQDSGPPTPIILISIDTLRADHLPVYGYQKVKTPAIDALAADGIVFEHAYAHAPQTLPSHAAILTGQLPFETGVRDNVGFTLRGDQETLAGRLRARGYLTGGVISAFVLRKETGISRGFDYFDDEMPPAAPDMPMGQVRRNGGDSLAVAERWMQGLSSPTFFLFFHAYDPHTPYRPPDRYRQYAPYDGEIAYSDEVVGQLMAWLKGRGWYDRALIIFLSDHGEGLGDHGELEHGLFLYDSTIRVPLIIKMPGGAGRGRRVSAPVQHIDLVPTVLDFLGAERPRTLRGRSLRPLIEGTGATTRDAGFYAEAFYGRYHFGWSELYSLTDARYRFIKAPRPELYDLQNDRAETRNLAADRPQIVTAARTELDRLLSGAKVEAPGQVSKEDLERLQALGYVGTQASVPLDSPAESLPDPKDKAPALEKFRQAISLSASRSYDQSITLLREVLADSPTMKDGWLQLGVELVRAGRLPEALDAFKHLVEADPTDANSFVSAGGVLFTLGRLADAQANAEMALSKAPVTDRRARTSACELMVKVAIARKDYDAARRAAVRSQQADPEFPLPAFVEGVILHANRSFDQALPQFEDAARHLQGHSFVIPELFFYLGDTLANLGREEEATSAFRQELQLFPLDVRARTSLAMLYRAGGRYAEAEREIDALLRVVPTPEGYAMAAKTWSIFGETGRADAVRAEARKRFGTK
jgi:choline-sulfatase